MNKKTNKLLIQFCFAAVVMVLLMVSPCSVRNAIEDYVGVQKTSVLNKSKAEFNKKTCTAFEHSKEISIEKVSEVLFCGESCFFKKFQPSFLVKLYQERNSCLKKSSQKIPLYILFQSLKLYI